MKIIHSVRQRTHCPTLHGGYGYLGYWQMLLWRRVRCQIPCCLSRARCFRLSQLIASTAAGQPAGTPCSTPHRPRSRPLS